MFKRLLMVGALLLGAAISGGWTRYAPTAPVTFTVSPTGSDSNDCLTGADCASFGHAIDLACRTISASGLQNLPNQIVVQNTTPGASYRENISPCRVAGQIYPAQNQNGFLKIDGNGATLDCGGAICFNSVENMSNWYITGFTMTDASWCFVADNQTFFYVGAVTCGASVGDANGNYGGGVEFEESWTSVGAKQYSLSAIGAGTRVIMRSGRTVTFGSGSSFSTAIISASKNGVLSVNGVLFSGSTACQWVCGWASLNGGLDGGVSFLTPISNNLVNLQSGGWED